jgi:hypothetical protein
MFTIRTLLCGVSSDDDAGIGMTAGPSEPDTVQHKTRAWFARRLFRRQNLTLAFVLSISIFMMAGGPGMVLKSLAERRCAHACTTYMRGEAGAQWVGPFADGAGYSALVSCMSDSLHNQEGYDCFRARVMACTQACAADPIAALQ